MPSLDTNKTPPPTPPPPPPHEGRDFALSLSVSGIILGLVIALVNVKLPDGIINGDVPTASAVGAVCALAASIAAWLFFGKGTIGRELPAAALGAVVVYAAVAAITWTIQTSSYRGAHDTASSWRQLINQDYEHVTGWTPNSTNAAAFGTVTTRLDKGVFYVAIASNRDETALTGPDGQNQPTVGSNFLLQADVTSAPGATDGYCTLIFGFTVGENWYAFKIGPQGVAVSQDFGQAQHRYLYGPAGSSFARTEHNKLTLLSKDGTVTLWVNRHQVTKFSADIPAGKTWVAPQAANRPDSVNCGFDNYQLDAP